MLWTGEEGVLWWANKIVRALLNAPHRTVSPLLPHGLAGVRDGVCRHRRLDRVQICGPSDGTVHVEAKLGGHPGSLVSVAGVIGQGTCTCLSLQVARCALIKPFFEGPTSIYQISTNIILRTRFLGAMAFTLVVFVRHLHSDQWLGRDAFTVTTGVRLLSAKYRTNPPKGAPFLLSLCCLAERQQTKSVWLTLVT